MGARRARRRAEAETEQSALIAAALLVECVAVAVAGRYIARRARPVGPVPRGVSGPICQTPLS
jgi:hypothetical protein